MSEREKFNESQLASEKIASAPEITVDTNDREQVSEQVNEPVATGSEPVRTVPDDPKIDERNTRLLVKNINLIKSLDSDINSAIEEFGANLWPLLRMFGMGWRSYTVLIGGLLAAPLVPSGFKILKALFSKKEKEDANGNS